MSMSEFGRHEQSSGDRAEDGGANNAKHCFVWLGLGGGVSVFLGLGGGVSDDESEAGFSKKESPELVEDDDPESDVRMSLSELS